MGEPYRILDPTNEPQQASPSTMSVICIAYGGSEKKFLRLP